MKSTKSIVNGRRVLVAPFRHTEAVTVFVCVKAGSRYEDERTNGIAHFCEHMFFKGGRRFPDTKSLALAMDAIGASYNALTYKDIVEYFVTAPSSRIELALSVLSDMLLNAKFDEDEISRERGVILQEIDASLDDSQHLLWHDWEKLILGNQPLGREIAGPPENIKVFTRQDFLRFRRNFYRPENIVISIAGKVPKNVLELVGRYFVADRRKDAPLVWAGFDPQLAKGFVSLRQRDTKQASIVLGTLAPPARDKMEVPASLLSAILGDGMSSRLFEVVRERAGLAYAVGSHYARYIDAGYFCAYAGVSPENTDLVIGKILEEIERARKNGVTKEELNKVRGMYEGHFARFFESSAGVARLFGKNELLYGRPSSAKEMLQRVMSVRLDEVNEAASALLDPDSFALAVVGPFDDEDRFKKLLKRQ